MPIEEGSRRSSLSESLLQTPRHGAHITVQPSGELTINPEPHGASILSATFNMVNIYVGVGLLSMPYAMRLAGWAGLAGLVAAVCLFGTSALLFVQAFDKLGPDAPHTFPALGQKVLGKPGRYIVAFFALCEFFGGSVVMMMLMWREMEAVLPATGVFGYSATQAAITISLVAMAPQLIAPSLRSLAWLSALGCLTTVLVALTLLVTVGLDPLRSKMPIQPPAGHDLWALGALPAFGIFAAAVSGHSSLPALRSSMHSQQDFPKVVASSFSLMALFYGMICALGYYYFGRAAADLVTVDLANNSIFTGHWVLLPAFTADKLVEACILVNAFTTYPLILLVIQDLAVSTFPHSREVAGARSAHSVARPALLQLLRIIVFLLDAAVGILAYRQFGNILSLVGGLCSITCSLLLPSLCFLLLYWVEIGWAKRCGIMLIMIVGGALLVLITSDNLKAILAPPQHHVSHFELLPGLL
ncbi:hypothetical protein WJX74_000120 [Apatococcus lobatus]|uniref:Amino acid transporter transmembrane domain-containing protein n=1 Tax=Apatococcus lobatus TaxID=904363 RepID=A0AAW1QHV2_9CHLO